VASIAFGAPVGAVDTNVRRVLGRALAGAGEIPPLTLQAAADASVDPVRSGDWTHAVMDIGATLCRPGRPLCDACPLRPWCRFAANGSEASPPRIKERAAPPSGARARAKLASQPFHQTTRWLRGRLVDRLRDADGSAWTVIDEPIGDHHAAAIQQALGALARDGIVEVDPLDGRRARLATT
jgi:A/G-specific adenine glycosylase